MNDNQLMYFNEHTDIYWHGTFVGAAVLLGIALMWVFVRRIREGAAEPLKYIVLLGYPVAVMLSRLKMRRKAQNRGLCSLRLRGGS